MVPVATAYSQLNMAFLVVPDAGEAASDRVTIASTVTVDYGFEGISPSSYSVTVFGPGGNSVERVSGKDQPKGTETSVGIERSSMEYGGVYVSLSVYMIAQANYAYNTVQGPIASVSACVRGRIDNGEYYATARRRDQRHALRRDLRRQRAHGDRHGHGRRRRGPQRRPGPERHDAHQRRQPTPSDAWTFTDGTNYNDASGTVDDSIAKANATINVTPYSVTYDGNAHTATGTATGVGGEDLDAGLNLSGTTHTNAGDVRQRHLDLHRRHGNYNDASGTVHDSIAQATATS